MNGELNLLCDDGFGSAIYQLELLGRSRSEFEVMLDSPLKVYEAV
jgi:hypothetical protein